MAAATGIAAELLAGSQLAQLGLTTAVNIYNLFRKQNPALPPVEQIVAEANAEADAVKATAKTEIESAEAEIAGKAGTGTSG